MVPPPDATGVVDTVRRVGSACWATVGIVLVLSLLLAALASISEVVLPFVFAAVLAVVFAPLAKALRGRGLRRSPAALAVVVLIVGAVVGTVVVAVAAVANQTDAWTANVDRAVDELGPTTDELGLEGEELEQARQAVAGATAVIAGGFLTLLVDGIGSIVGFVAGAVLGVLLLYYLLKDTAPLRERVIGWWPLDAQTTVDAFFSRSAQTIRSYEAGRAVLSATVTLIITGWSAIVGLPMLGAIAIVNFIGGFVPYVGGFIGGGVAVVLALAEGGIGLATATLVVVLVCNFAIENLLEPHVMGQRLQLHPMLVLIVTTLGGVLGGVVGLMLAVPLFLVVSDAVATAWRHRRPVTEGVLRLTRPG